MLIQGKGNSEYVQYGRNSQEQAIVCKMPPRADPVEYARIRDHCCASDICLELTFFQIQTQRFSDL